MKTLFSIIALFISIPFISFAQDQKGTFTEHIQVSGVCGDCKERIEKAAYIPGVKRAEWNKDTKELTVTYKAPKTSLEKIEESIANAGHDAGEIKASDSAYQKLPSCCAYKEVADH